jgi:hypothetical protein
VKDYGKPQVPLGLLSFVTDLDPLDNTNRGDIGRACLTHGNGRRGDGNHTTAGRLGKT